jgi:hypothetical protein
MVDRIERIERGALPDPVVGVTRNAPVDPDGARRDHPPDEQRSGGRGRVQPRRAPAGPQIGDDGRPHVDVEA